MAQKTIFFFRFFFLISFVPSCDPDAVWVPDSGAHGIPFGRYVILKQNLPSWSLLSLAIFSCPGLAPFRQPTANGLRCCLCSLRRPQMSVFRISLVQPISLFNSSSITQRPNWLVWEWGLQPFCYRCGLAEADTLYMFRNCPGPTIFWRNLFSFFDQRLISQYCRPQNTDSRYFK